ncbi:MAG TPA: vanadium-dependent haloperoxidase [Chitinophagaceae bacterium]
MKLAVITWIMFSFGLQLNGGTLGKNGSDSEMLAQWMELHCRMIRFTKGISHVAYTRHFAYTSIAVYEAGRQSERGYTSLTRQLNGLETVPVATDKKLHGSASVSAAYAEMLRHFYGSFPACSILIDSLESAQRINSSSTGSEKLTQQSKAHGKSIAQAVITWAQQDNSTATIQYKPKEGESFWQPTPPAFSPAAVPHWGNNRTLVKGENELAKILQAPVYGSDSSADFYKMAKEVYQTSENLTAEQKEIALYWDDSPDGKYITVPGHWAHILTSLIRHHKLSIMEAAEAYVKMSVAMHDAAVLTWAAKYQYGIPRPVTFIQRYFKPGWLSLIGTPPHPEFPAAHATLSNAAATALCSTFGEKCSFTDSAYVVIGMRARSYATLKEAAREAGMSRLYGGIHYRYSIEQGLSLGERTAQHVVKNIRFHQ